MTPANSRRCSRGQTLAELGIVMPFLIFLFLAIFQVGFLIYQQYDAINLAREAANLMRSDDNLDVAEAAIRAAQLTRKFDTDVKLVMSRLELGSPGGPNAAKPIIIHRHVAGTLAGASVLGDPPSSAYGPGPSYTANDPSKDTTIQALPLPNHLRINPGQSVFVAEVFIKRRDILPLSGNAQPNLYAVAFF